MRNLEPSFNHSINAGTRRPEWVHGAKHVSCTALGSGRARGCSDDRPRVLGLHMADQVWVQKGFGNLRYTIDVGTVAAVVIGERSYDELTNDLTQLPVGGAVHHPGDRETQSRAAVGLGLEVVMRDRDRDANAVHPAKNLANVRQTDKHKADMSDQTPTSRPNDFASRVHRPQKRTKTSCRPCRERKVKCDGRTPCQSCRKRQYPDLCYYEDTAPQRGRTDIYDHQPPSTPTSLGRWHTSGASHPRYLGDQSIPAFIQSEKQGHALSATSILNDANEGVMPILGLSAAPESPYPFMPVSSLFEPLDTLPNTRELLRTLQSFRQEVAPFIPNFLDIDRLEIESCEFLQAQDSADRSQLHASTEIRKPPSNAWLAMLYSILAVGVQVSDLPQSERSRQSSLYSRYSFQFLRNANFLLYPNETCVQSLLMLGIFLQNDASPEAAWMLLGTTVRVAQSIGLHTAAGSSTSLIYPQNKSNAIWVAVIWQDTLLSMCFDRPTSIIMDAPPALDVLISPDQSLSYHESMYYLNLCLNHGRSLRNIHNFDIILKLVERIESIKSYMCHELQDLQSCKNIQQMAHFFAFNLHFSFSIAWICRPALSQPAQSSDTRREITEKCHQNLIAALRAFLKLQPICLFAARSWSFFHNGISSALLLALIDDTKADPEVRTMQECLLRTLPQQESDCIDRVTTSEHSGPALTKAHARALGFLQKLRASQANRNTSRNGPAPATTSSDQSLITPQEANYSDLHAEVPKNDSTSINHPLDSEPLAPLGLMESIFLESPSIFDEAFFDSLASMPAL